MRNILSAKNGYVGFILTMYRMFGSRLRNSAAEMQQRLREIASDRCVDCHQELQILCRTCGRVNSTTLRLLIFDGGNRACIFASENPDCRFHGVRLPPPGDRSQKSWSPNSVRVTKGFDPRKSAGSTVPVGSSSMLIGGMCLCTLTGFCEKRLSSSDEAVNSARSGIHTCVTKAAEAERYAPLGNLRFSKRRRQQNHGTTLLDRYFAGFLSCFEGQSRSCERFFVLYHRNEITELFQTIE